MNRFRTKRKGKDEDGQPRPSQESESSMPFRGFRKGKKSQEAEKKEVDLAAVLPSNDDFRTSLLMTGLSARFSMLREQDDPNTKIGKASDDSVLYPKRQSRIDLASFRGLGDIAEVESIKAASPFARMESYHSDDADSSKSGSIMSRAKPTEGNNLFGGRQKIYKISATSSTSKADGGMGGRALYDDDVAQSAFQKWRRAERERELSQDEQDDSDTQEDQRNSADLEPPRSESPTFSNYDRKRETSSTLSSIPSIARHSSAATSITSSQPAPSVKDWQPPSGYSSGPERSVTRTRRLYETGFFTQDAPEAATSRQRPFGARTPELKQTQTPSLRLPDRLSGDRKLLTKGSAPNLQSISPPASASPTGGPNLGIRVPGTAEGKSTFGGGPPLSPPISETDENSILSINPNDRGKATALGVFRKPAQPYDESRYAQRQLQLQRGRETPTMRTRDEPNPPASGTESRSLSPVSNVVADSPTVPLSEAAQFPSKGEAQPTSFLVDDDGSETSSMISPKPIPSPQIHLRRPSDREHPALRDPNLPAQPPAKPGSELAAITERPASLIVDAKSAPADSPTLGPVTGGSGLSGMVRQHLRANSNASSIYEGVPPTSGLESRFPVTPSSQPLHDYGAGSNPWEGEDQGRDWNLDLDVNEPLGDAELFMSDLSRSTEAKVGSPVPNSEHKDEFANQLADGARRIREKLTSYVETESRSSSPHRMPEQNVEIDSVPLPRPSGLGAILRPRSSRGSLTDRGRDPSSTRALKMMGISPGGSRTASPASESQRRRVETDVESRHENEEKEATQGADDHPGLRQFRQARRELQRLKELETQSRHYPAPQGPPPDIPSPRQINPNSPRQPRTRTHGRDHEQSPARHQQRIPNEELRMSDSPPNSRARPWNDRQHSESESSRGTPHNARAPRTRDESASWENGHLGPSRSGRRPPMRSPGLPGTDIKHSHIMPPQPHPNVSSRTNQSNFDSNGKLYVPRGYESGQPSPISPGVSPLVNSAPPTPAASSPPRPPFVQAPSDDHSTGHIANPPEYMKRKVKPRDISEPTLVMSTSRVPTVALPPEAEGNPSRSNSRAAPPLPPINPRRRQDSTNLRTGTESMARQGRDNFNRLPPNVGPLTSRIVPTQGRTNKGNPGLPGGMI